MKNKQIKNISLIIFLVIIAWSCKKEYFRTDFKDFSVKAFISSIKSYNVNSEYDENMMPVDTTSADKPYVSVQSWVIKGKDILMSITVPDDAEELYFGAINSQAEYMGLNFEGQAQNQATGYYVLKLNSISNPDTATNELRNFQVVLSSNENIQIDKFDLLVSCKTTKGISNKTSIPINVASIAPYQKNLKVGFRPLSGYTYTIQVSTPSGAKITYSYNKNTGTETFNNSQIPNTSLSYDSGIDFKWIDFSDPEFGGYSMTATIQIDLTGGSQYIYLYLAIITEGIIDQVSLDADIQQTGQNTAIGTAVVGFNYFSEKRVIVDIVAHRPQNHYIIRNILFDLSEIEAYNLQRIPEHEEMSKGIGIRMSTDKNSLYYYSTNRNLLQAELNISNVTKSKDINYFLINQSDNIVVYNDFQRWNKLLDPNQESKINFSSFVDSKTIWIEATGKVNGDFLILQARDDNNNYVLSADTIRLRTFKSVVFCFRGEEVPPNDILMDGVPDNLQGVFNIADLLYGLGYDARKISDNDRSIAFEEIKAMLANNSIENYLFIGYSHGAGTISILLDSDVLPYLINNNKSINIPYSAYIDAIQNDSPLNMFAVTEKPILIDYLHNYYQRNIPNECFFYGSRISGIPDSSVENEDFTVVGKSHCVIHQVPEIKSTIAYEIVQYPK